MTTLARPLLTVEEFLASGDSDGYELVHGVPEEICMGFEAAWLGGRVHRQIDVLCEETGIGTVVSFEAPLAVWPDEPDHFRKPDVMFYRRGRVPAGRGPKGQIRVVPDLIVEIVSPHDVAGRFESKLSDYRKAGVPLVWVIYPETENAHIHRPNMVIEVIERGGTLDGEDILPGFALSLPSLFEAAARAFPE